MAKYILPTILFLFSLALVLPMIVLAAHDDVQFPADTNIYLTTPGITLVIKANSEVASLTVNPTNFQVGLDNGSYLKVVSAGKLILSNPLVVTDCATSESSITINYTGAATTITVTPAGTCVTGGGSLPSAPAAPAPPAEPTPTPPAAAEGSATPAAGGQVVLTNPEGGGVAVQVPAGAVTADTAFSVQTASATAVASAPSGLFMVAGQIYQVSATADGASVTEFGAPLTLTFTYTDAQLGDVNESSLQVYYYDTDTSSWVALETTLDTANNTATTTTSHLTDFTLMGEEEAAKPIEEMTAEELRAMIIEIQKQLIELIQQLIQLLQEQINQLLQAS